MTLYDVLLAHIGDTPLDSDGTPTYCPCHFFAISDEDCMTMTCWNCWHREWKGEKYIGYPKEV